MDADKIRKKLNFYNRAKVARETGLTEVTLHRFMHEIGEPTKATLDKLEAFFKKVEGKNEQ